VEAKGVCAEAVPELASRLERLLARSAAEGLRTSVTLERAGAGYRLTLGTTRAAAPPAETVLVAPTCEEAADAALVVLALALGVEVPAETSDAPAERAAPSLPAQPEAPDVRTFGAERPPAPEREARKQSAPPLAVLGGERSRVRVADPGDAAVRVSLATGVDAGTLSLPTLYAAAGVSRSLSALELRGLVRYGFPAVEENEDAGVSEAERSDFGALELRSCYGTTGKLRLAACGGGELGVLRSSRRLEREAGVDEDEDGVSARLSGVLAAVVSHRGGAVQPELEFSGSGVALGRDEGASWLVLRVSAGAAVEF
jgi:hypothetical protein